MTVLTNDSEQNLIIVRTIINNLGISTVLREITLAQAILEGALLSSPPSKLALEDCNLFGQKPSSENGSWATMRGTNTAKGGVVDYYTSEYTNGEHNIVKQTFLSNYNIEDSINQHLKLLEGLSRYRSVIDAQTFTDAAAGLKNGGYATDPHYFSDLEAIYNEYVKK